MMMTSYEAPGYGATTTPGYLDQHHQYAWQFAGLSGYQRLHQQNLQQQQQQFEQQKLQPPPSQHAVNVAQQYYGNTTQFFLFFEMKSNFNRLETPSHGTGYVIVRPLSTVEYTSVVSVFHCRRGLTNLIHDQHDGHELYVVHTLLSSVGTSACLFHAGANGRVGYDTLTHSSLDSIVEIGRKSRS